MTLGPKTRIYLERNSGSTNIYLLQGWLKIRPSAGAGGQAVQITTRSVRVNLSQSAGVIHSSDSLIEVFVENGSLTLTETGSKKKRKMRLLEEQYAQRKGEEPLQPAGRPPGSFITAMPNAFFDPLVLLSGRPLAALLPKKIRDVEFADVASLLQAPGLAELAKRFAPRLTNPD